PPQQPLAETRPFLDRTRLRHEPEPTEEYPPNRPVLSTRWALAQAWVLSRTSPLPGPDPHGAFFSRRRPALFPGSGACSRSRSVALPEEQAPPDHLFLFASR
ncbi:unnamed protein product, partial [Ectocarpus sp. 12 AP-2014]